jgi:hypothetical protein
MEYQLTRLNRPHDPFAGRRRYAMSMDVPPRPQMSWKRRRSSGDAWRQSSCVIGRKESTTERHADG